MKEKIAEIHKTLDMIVKKGHDPATVFADFVAFMFWGFLRNEQRYQYVLRRYKEGEVGSRGGDYLMVAAELLARYTKETKEDLLNPLFGLMNKPKKNDTTKRTQIFTPKEICDFITQSVVDIAKREFGQNTSLTWIDGFTGSGSFSVSAKNKDKNGLFVTCDVDILCCQMTTINCILHNIDAIVLHGDTFDYSIWRAWTVKATSLGIGVANRFPVEPARKYMKEQQRWEYETV